MSDLLINNLFKSQAVLVEREEEYLPVVTEKKEYSWENAHKEYTNKRNRGPLRPFYERFEEEQKAKEK